MDLIGRAIISGAVNAMSSQTVTTTVPYILPRHLHHVLHVRFLDQHHVDIQTAGSHALSAAQQDCAVFTCNDDTYRYEIREFDAERLVIEDDAHNTIVAPVKRKFAYLMADHDAARAFQQPRRDEWRFSGSDGAMVLYQGVQDLAVATFARIVMAFVPDTHEETRWMLTVIPRSAPGVAAMGAIANAIGRFRFGAFGMSGAPRGGTAFSFDRPQHAHQVHHERERIVNEVGIEMADLSISDVWESTTNECTHPGPFTETANHLARCMACGRFAGAWPM
jgi:hypothetical protein